MAVSSRAIDDRRAPPQFHRLREPSSLGPMMRRLALLGWMTLGIACSSSSTRRPPPARYGPPPLRYGAPPAPPLAGPPLSQAEIQAGVRRVQPDIQTCFARTMMDQRNATGRVVVRFMIEPAGQVSSVQIQQSNMAEPMNRCVFDVMQRLTFRPHSGRPQGVVYPLSFN